MRLVLGVLVAMLGGCDTAPAHADGATIGPSAAPSAPLRAATTTSAPAAAPAAASASAAPVSGFPPSALIVRRGLWIWDFENNAPPAARAAEIAKSAGFRRVFIKAAEGAPDTMPPSQRWARNFSDENVKPFVDAGLEVWAFGYFYPDRYRSETGIDWGSLEAQVDVAVKNATRPGVTGIVVDAEAEFYDRSDDAVRLCKLLRHRFRGKVAYTSFGWLSVHRRFPFKAFDTHCGDAFLPQVYSTFGWPGGVTTSMERLARDVAELGLTAPVWPIQSIERAPPASEIARFFSLAGPDASLFYLAREGETSTRNLLEWSTRPLPAPPASAP